ELLRALCPVALDEAPGQLVGLARRDVQHLCGTDQLAVEVNEPVIAAGGWPRVVGLAEGMLCPLASPRGHLVSKLVGARGIRLALAARGVAHARCGIAQRHLVHPIDGTPTFV